MYGNNSAATTLPVISNYHQAVSTYNNIVPLKSGPDKGRRVLSWNRRNKHMYMVKEGSSIKCCLYDTSLIEFYSNGYLRIRTEGWTSPTTLAFINAIVRPFGYLYTHKSNLIWYSSKDGGDYQYHPRGLVIHPDHPIPNTTPFKQHFVNRKAMNIVKKPLEDFLKYATTMADMRDHKVDKADIDAAMHAVEGVLKKYGAPTTIGTPLTTYVRERKAIEYCLTLCPQDKRLWGVTTLLLMSHFNTFSYGWSSGWRGRLCSPAKLKAGVYHILKRRHRDIVFTAKELPMGVYKPDPNREFF